MSGHRQEWDRAWEAPGAITPPTPPLRFIEECTPGGTMLSRKLQYHIDGQWVDVPVMVVTV